VLEPKQADDILFEMFVHGWIDQEHKLHVTKYTLPELADVIATTSRSASTPAAPRRVGVPRAVND
jgi:hypothetical protein